MRSHARLHVIQTVDAQGMKRSHISRLRSEGALVLRPTRETLPPWTGRWDLEDEKPVTVRLVAGAAGPLGGDSLRLEVTVAEGAALMLGTVAATLVLPGVHGEQSCSEVNISVADGGTLIWNPGLQIASRDCRHQTLNTVALARDARLFAREETALGRHGETPGEFRQRLRVTRAGIPIYDQELAVGPGVPGWDGAAVTGNRRSLGTILVVGPLGGIPKTHLDDAPPDTALMRMSEDTLLITSVAPDAVELDRRLTTTFDGLLTSS